ncbi:serine hydrolase domain-containing protein [Flexivirga oryzae]|uniref:CubicO group peptidase (Beta-lactamase class C family) n=1 Tax=Flexivirga oryzae TaxID=1794944 RepID=A0A839NDH6_9MICO|nr:serine hydrolase domain-containing protein [Flexivirga oryzae]MBB2892592.1 CubicO group peptidase (beta-lactamase class C family) [Flexivirga oryzae]
MALHTALTHLFDARLAEAQRTSRAPSAAAAVIGNGEIVWSGAAGRTNGRPDGETATTATQYRIGSITKTFTAVLTLRLVEDGLVTLTDPVAQHLPELADRLPGVRVSELLTHGAGLPAETEGAWWERSQGRTWDELQPSIRLIHRPGRRFHYSNVGFAVAGELVARLRDSTWWDRLQVEVLEPLRLRDTTYAPTAAAAPGLAVHPYADLLHDEPATDTFAMAPAGQLWSTVHDLAVFAKFLARGDRRVLSDELRTEMQIPALINDDPGASYTRAYGFGLDIINHGGQRFIGHGGSMPGHQSALRIDPETGDGAVQLVNSTAGLDLDNLQLVHALRERAPRIGSAWTADPAHTEAADIVGTWFWGPRPHLLTREGSGLRLAPLGGGRGSRFAPDADGGWIGLDEYFAGERLTVHRDAGSAPAYLDLGSFRFARTPYDPAGDIPGGAGTGWR